MPALFSIPLTCTSVKVRERERETRPNKEGDSLCTEIHIFSVKCFMPPKVELQ